MKDVIYLQLHFLTTTARLVRPGGGSAVIAENLLLVKAGRSGSVLTMTPCFNTLAGKPIFEYSKYCQGLFQLPVAA